MSAFTSCGQAAPWALFCHVPILLQKSQIARRYFSAVKKFDRRPLVDLASITLPRSPASLSSGDEVSPTSLHEKSRVQPKEILITSAKRLLQHNLPNPTKVRRSKLPYSISRSLVGDAGSSSCGDVARRVRDSRNGIYGTLCRER